MHVHRSTLAIPGFVFAVTLPLNAPAWAEQRALDTQQSTITVHVFKSGLFRALADDHLIKAALVDGSLDDSATPRVELVVAANQMRVLDPGLSPKDRSDVQARMLGPEVLDATRFAHIRFRSTAVQLVESDHWLVRGDLDLHGQTHQVAVKVIRQSGHYKGSTTLRQTEFGITPITIAGGTVKVKDEIAIDFDVVVDAVSKTINDRGKAATPSTNLNRMR
jgi:polyisoprenoid-binding protein YceI